jgi:hypothetical protein
MYTDINIQSQQLMQKEEDTVFVATEETQLSIALGKGVLLIRQIGSDGVRTYRGIARHLSLLLA